MAAQVYFPEGIVAADIIPRMLKQNVIVAAGLHRDVKGEINLSFACV